MIGWLRTSGQKSKPPASWLALPSEVPSDGISSIICQNMMPHLASILIGKRAVIKCFVLASEGSGVLHNYIMYLIRGCTIQT